MLRGDNRTAGQAPCGHSKRSAQGHDLVPIHNIPIGIDGHDAICIAVVGKSYVRAELTHCPLECLRIGRPATDVDVVAVRRVIDHRSPSAQRPKGRGRGAAGRAVRAVDHDMQPVQPTPGDAHREPNVYIGGVNNVAGDAHAGAMRARKTVGLFQLAAPMSPPPAAKAPASISASNSSASLNPSGPKNLMPLYSAGL